MEPICIPGLKGLPAGAIVLPIYRELLGGPFFLLECSARYRVYAHSLHDDFFPYLSRDTLCIPGGDLKIENRMQNLDLP